MELKVTLPEDVARTAGLAGLDASDQARFLLLLEPAFLFEQCGLLSGDGGNDSRDRPGACPRITTAGWSIRCLPSAPLRLPRPSGNAAHAELKSRRVVSMVDAAKTSAPPAGTSSRRPVDASTHTMPIARSSTGSNSILAAIEEAYGLQPLGRAGCICTSPLPLP
jgi:hypothetical protein